MSLDLHHLCIVTADKSTKILNDISFCVADKQKVAIIGQSGSGKSMIAMSILGLLPPKELIITKGEIVFDEVCLNTLSQQDYNKIRGNDISVIFQEPMNSLNPSMICGLQIDEIIKNHSSLTKKQRYHRVIELLENVKIPNAKQTYKKYPHQLSGGQRQRVMIAIAIACSPKLLIADEPTTALDVTVQKEILQLLDELQAQFKMSIVFISHDINLVEKFADKVIVMKNGVIVEQGDAQQIFKTPQHPYTQALIKAQIPNDFRIKKFVTIEDSDIDTASLVKTEEEYRQESAYIYQSSPMIKVSGLQKIYTSGNLWSQHSHVALQKIDFEVYQGESLGIIGESGSGKSTIANILIGLQKMDKGDISYLGKTVDYHSRKEMKQYRKEVQMVFQDPYASLNPFYTVGASLIEAMQVHNILDSDANRRKYILDLFDTIQLSQEHFDRKPHEFSGGQRQRIVIARALITQPKVIICDEIVSALDIFAQAQILNLMNDLKEKYNLTYVFISHDLSVVKQFCDRIILLYKGEIIEQGASFEMYQNPKEPYTQKFIEASIL